MAYTLYVKQEAVDDAMEAYEFYENKVPGLGERFLEALANRYLDLSMHPHHYGFIAEDPLNILRDVKLEKFPYVIVFELNAENVFVYAIHNTRKNPVSKIRKI